MGRTQLQDAVPMTLGQEFSTFAVMLGEDEERLKEASTLICEINLGATAIATGTNASPEYAQSEGLLTRLACGIFSFIVCA
jgi:aspartate ammonia-lyase